MTKSDLIRQMAIVAGIPRRRAAQALEAFTEGVTGALAAGTAVTLRGFGRFSIRPRPPRHGCHPRHGGRIAIPARRAIRFVSGKKLKDIIG